MTRPILLLSLIALVLPATGCAAVVAGAAATGTIQYLRNEASRDYAATPEATWTATLQALRDHGYPVDPSAAYAQRGGRLEVNDVKVWVRPYGAGRTRVRLRVGTFDTDAHRERARLVLDAVGAHLGV
jgi:hypothetical protein